jgi:hypothetical protein
MLIASVFIIRLVCVFLPSIIASTIGREKMIGLNWLLLTVGFAKAGLDVVISSIVILFYF